MTRSVRCAFLLCAILATGGCSKPHGEVEGTVTLDGKPVRGIVVYFVPDYDAGANGLPAQGTTDANGRYTLASMSKAQKGVFVGKHLVMCTTPMIRLPAESSGSDSVPGLYSNPDKTPLRFEVKEGKQTIDIQLTSKPEAK